MNYEDFDINPDEILKREQEAQTSSSYPKVNWHSLPSDDTPSTWRILPWIQGKSFFRKVEKHWHVPNIRGISGICPRSFINPETGKPFQCAVCDKRWEFFKSTNEAEQEVSKLLRSQSAYIMNAVDIEHQEKGVGVLGVNYAVYQALIALLSNPQYKNFFHVKDGRNLWIKATFKAGTSIPGNPNRQKRDFTVQAMDKTPIENMGWLEDLYDLDTIYGIPSYNLTQSWLAKYINPGDEKAGEEFITDGNLYLRLDSGENDTSFDTSSFVPPVIKKEEEKPEPLRSPSPAFAIDKNTPTTEIDAATGKPVCFGVGFNEDNKICLKCPNIDDCETAVLKAKRQAVKSQPPAQNDVESELMRVLKMGK